MNEAVFARSVFRNTLLRAWQVLRGPVSISVIAGCLSPAEQGVYYALTSIGAATVLFELGIGIVCTQMAASLAAQYNTADSRSADLLAICNRFYAVSAALFAIVATGASAWLLRGVAAPPMGLVAAFAGSTAVYLWLNGRLAFLEGIGRADRVASARLIGTIAGTLTCWALMPVLGTASIVAMNACLAGAAMICVAANRDALPQRPSLRHRALSFTLDIWPTQWRIALSWAAGWFVFQLYVPLLMTTRGPIEAGRMGMTWAAVSAVPTVAMAQVSPRLAQFSALIARGDRGEADRLFRRCQRRSLLLSVLCGVALIAIVWAIPGLFPRLGPRLLGVAETAIMVLGTLGYVAISGMAMYARAAGGEPFLGVSLALAISNILLSCALAPRFGAAGLAWAYAATTLLIGLPYARRVSARTRGHPFGKTD